MNKIEYIPHYLIVDIYPDSLEVVRDTYGYCASAKAVEKKEEGIILTKK